MAFTRMTVLLRSQKNPHIVRVFLEQCAYPMYQFVPSDHTGTVFPAPPDT